MTGSTLLDVGIVQEVTTMQRPTRLMVSHPVGGWPEDAALADFPLEERILVVLAHQPWASASDSRQKA